MNMANKHLRRSPHNRIDGLAWWYEESDGIAVLIDIRSPVPAGGGAVKTVISWAALRAALKRKDRQP